MEATVFCTGTLTVEIVVGASKHDLQNSAIKGGRGGDHFENSFVFKIVILIILHTLCHLRSTTGVYRKFRRISRGL